MSIIDVLDTFYPKESEKERIRKTVRAILLNDKNEIYLLHIKCEDKFGARDHFETPGGGVEEMEDNLTTLHREIMEETGYTIKDITYLGDASIEYHLLNRIDIASFYICHTEKKFEARRIAYEKEIFQESKWVPVKDILSFYENNPARTVGKMIHKRDLACIKKALELGLICE